MNTKVYKFIFANMDKEEEWLNEMAQQGFNFLDNFFLRYTFSEGTPNEFIYRIERLENDANHPVSRKYIRFLEDTGVECVSISGKWAYFRKKAAEGPFDLYSDINAKINHYKRNLTYVLTLLFFNLIILTMNLIIGFAKKLPANISISITVLVFTVILVRTIIHYAKKIKTLKEEQQIHE